MSTLHETPSGLLVPESALPPVTPQSSTVNPFDIIFPSKASAERFAARCAVRWQYHIGMVNTAGEDEPERWRAVSRKGNGVVHDTQSPAYAVESNDTKLVAFINIKEHSDKAYSIVNKV